jgi:selenocysteine lyase/cysteine desulfurase
MTIDQLLKDEEARRQAFPVTRSQIYLAHAAVGPLPAQVSRAMRHYIRRAERLGQIESLHSTAEAHARASAAALLDVTTEEIAFVPSTSAGLAMVAAGIEWHNGDRVLIQGGDFPANVYPWQNLGRLGVRVDQLPARADGLIDPDDVKARLEPRTRLVSLSSVHYATGASLDIDAVGKFLRERDILFCVDAIQSLGAVPCSARFADALVADAHKWLLGPQGIAILAVRREAFPRIRPALVGWKSATAPYEFHQPTLELADSARRYEPGSLNVVGLVGLDAALSLLHTVGIPAVCARLQSLRALLTEALRARGYCLLGPAAPLRPTGITSFRGPDNMAMVHSRLADHRCVVSLRKDPRGEDFLRVSPHFYNTAEELGRFLELLDEGKPLGARADPRTSPECPHH